MAKRILFLAFFIALSEAIEMQIKPVAQIVDISDIPYQASLNAYMNLTSFNYYYPICGGVIISKTIILVAGHCLNLKLNVESYRVVAGNSLVWLKYPQTYDYSVKKVLRHPKMKGTRNDIAIIWLTKPFRMSNRLQMARLPPKGAPVPVGEAALASGWRWTKRGHSEAIISPMMYIRRLKVENASVCQEHYEAYDDDSQMCASISIRSNASLFIDTGGPLVIDGVVYGLSTHGLLGHKGNGIVWVFTNVITALDFIVENAGNNL